LVGLTQQKGYTLIPLKVYFKGGKAKVEIGLARGKSAPDKRETIKKKEAKREIDQALKARTRSENL
jgi:SsrA-binding protein